MSNYVPHYTKKKQTLARKRLVLRRLIKAGAAEKKILLAAEVVRDARIRALRAQRATIAPKGDADDLFAKIDEKLAAQLETTAMDILAEFGVDPPGAQLS